MHRAVTKRTQPPRQWLHILERLRPCLTSDDASAARLRWRSPEYRRPWAIAIAIRAVPGRAGQ